MIAGMGERQCQKAAVRLRGALPVETSDDQLPTEAVEQPEDAVRFADSGCLDHGLNPSLGPGVVECSLLRETRLIANEVHRLLVAGHR